MIRQGQNSHYFYLKQPSPWTSAAFAGVVPVEQVLGEIIHITGGTDPQNAEQPSLVQPGQCSRV